MTMVSASSSPGAGLLERYFGFTERGTTLARDTMAGVTTFVVMSYIIALNPIILTAVADHTGYKLPFSGVVTSTCVVANTPTFPAASRAHSSTE